MSTNVRRINNPIWFDQVVDGTVVSDVQDFSFCVGAGVQVVNSDASSLGPESFFVIEGSNDGESWADILQTKTIINPNMPVEILNIPNIYVRFLRLKVSVTSGSVNIRAHIHGKGYI